MDPTRALAAMLVALAVLTVGHASISSVRRRRRDFAVLQTLGFVRRQVSATIAWQATALVGLALLFGVPVGIAFGRWSWLLFSHQLGVDPPSARRPSPPCWRSPSLSSSPTSSPPSPPAWRHAYRLPSP